MTQVGFNYTQKVTFKLHEMTSYKHSHIFYILIFVKRVRLHQYIGLLVA